VELRLKGRSTDSAEVIHRRLRDAAEDLGHWTEFDYVVINDRFEQAIDDLQAIVENRGKHLVAPAPGKWCIWRRAWADPLTASCELAAFSAKHLHLQCGRVAPAGEAGGISAMISLPPMEP